MADLQLYQAALGVTPPWRVVRREFDVQAGCLDLGD